MSPRSRLAGVLRYFAVTKDDAQPRYRMGCEAVDPSTAVPVVIVTDRQVSLRPMRRSSHCTPKESIRHMIRYMAVMVSHTSMVTWVAAMTCMP